MESLGNKQIIALLAYYEQLLADYRPYIDSLNVFPVPDGDTGTNMYLTMKSVLSAIEGLNGITNEVEEPKNETGKNQSKNHLQDASAEESATKKDPTRKAQAQKAQAIYESAIKGAVMGARGNSGVLLSQIVKGFFTHFSSVEAELNPQAWVEGCVEAAKSAYEAVSEPVEGTMLTVIGDISKAGKKAFEEDKDIELAELCDVFKSAGEKSLAKTPELLEVLKKAGVVDAGGAGVLLLFDALTFIVTGRSADPSPEVKVEVLETEMKDKKETGADLGTRYEVMYLLHTTEDQIPNLKKKWQPLGDSIVISGAGEIWSCHIHTDEIGKTIEAGIACGTPENIRVTDLHEQVEHSDLHLHSDPNTKTGHTQITQSEPDSEFIFLGGFADVSSDSKKSANTQIVAVGQGRGIAETFESMGVRAMVLGGQTQNPSAEVFLSAIEQMEADEVIILPNNSNIIAVANSISTTTKGTQKSPAQESTTKKSTAKKSTGQKSGTKKTIQVVETKTIPEGVAALLSYDPETSATENVAAMAQAKDGIVSGQVTKAVKDADAFGVKAGEFIGLDAKDILISSSDLLSGVIDLLKKLITPAHELLTLIAGEDAPKSVSDEILNLIAGHYPDLEVELIDGGQALYHYYIGLE